jgi:hypothetical protein
MAMSILELHDDIGRQPWGSAAHVHRSAAAMPCAFALQTKSNPKPYTQYLHRSVTAMRCVVTLQTKFKS